MNVIIDLVPKSRNIKMHVLLLTIGIFKYQTMRGLTAKTGAGRQGVGAGRQGIGAGRQGVGAGRRGVGIGRLGGGSWETGV